MIEVMCEKENDEPLSIVDFKNKLTFTYHIRCKEVDRVINTLFEISEHRLSDELLSKLNKTPEDCLFKIPTKYIFNLCNLEGYRLHELRELTPSVNPYFHYYFDIDRDIQLKIFYYKYVQGSIWYSITKENYPQMRDTGFDSFKKYVDETNPERLKWELQPTPELVMINWIDLNNINQVCQNIKLRYVQ